MVLPERSTPLAIAFSTKVNRSNMSASPTLIKFHPEHFDII